MPQTVNKFNSERQCAATSELSTCHSHSVQSNCQLNVPRHCVSAGHVGMPAQRRVELGLGSSGCYQAYTAGSSMGNRLADCAVGAASASGDHQQSVSGVMDTRTYRDCSQWPSAPPNCAVMQHSSSSDWSPQQYLVPSSDVNRSLWVNRQSSPAVNGIDTRCNYAPNVHASQVYAHQPCSQMPNQFLSTSMPAARFRGVGTVPAVSVHQMWMQPQPQQQQIAHNACPSSMPIRSMPVVYIGKSTASPTVWQSRFASPSLNNARLPTEYVMPAAAAAAAAAATNISQSESTSNVSAAVSGHVTAPSHSPTANSVTDSPLRNNTVGRVYQLPAAQTPAVTTVRSEHEVRIQSPVTACVSLSTTVAQSASVMTTTKPAVNMKPVVKAVITPSQPESERTYVAGRRYTVTKEDGKTVEGIWDGKYLTVLTTAANSSALQSSGLFVC